MKLFLSSSYFPNIEYIHYIESCCEDILVEKHESYLKQTYRNRCRIMTANGVQDLIIPVIKVNGNNTRIGDIQISYATDWQRLHWRAITSAYSSSPYFMYYEDIFKPLFESNEFTSLLDFNMKILEIVLKILNIKKDIQFTDRFIKEIDGKDLRYTISPKQVNTIGYFKPYEQVYSYKLPFCPNLSILDLIFNLGPEAKLYLNKMLHA